MTNGNLERLGSDGKRLETVAIRVATADDAAEILALQRRAYESEARAYNDWSIPPLMQTLDSMLEDIQTITVIKAMKGPSIVGSVRGKLCDQTCLVGRLIVEPALQGQGIGSALLQAIEQSFPEATDFELFTGDKSEGNIRLYSRHGSQIAGTKILSERVSIVVMNKRRRT